MTERHLVDFDKLVSLYPTYPTHLHAPSFWEKLGRVIATFAFLEEVLGKAIFALTATREYDEKDLTEAYSRWLPTLQKALSDPLGGLVASFERSVIEHGQSTIEDLDELVRDLKAAAQLRNVLCHGSWRPPTVDGKSLPYFVSRKNEVFETPLGASQLDQTQRNTVELICAVINTVTHMGFQFPGSTGPGRPVIPDLA